jgi:hypothetical protein
MIKETKSWLCGTTNSILTQQKEIDLLVNVRMLTPVALIYLNAGDRQTLAFSNSVIQYWRERLPSQQPIGSGWMRL